MKLINRKSPVTNLFCISFESNPKYANYKNLENIWID